MLHAFLRVSLIGIILSTTGSTFSSAQQQEHTSHSTPLDGLIGPCFDSRSQASLSQQETDCDRRLQQLTQQARRRDTTALRIERAQAHNNRGLIRFGRGRLAAARNDFTVAIALAPELYVAHVNRAVVNCRNNAAKEAESDFAMSLKLRADAAILYMRALCRERLGPTTLAIEDAKSAVRKDPDNVRRQQLLKRLADKLGQHDLALEVAYNLRFLDALPADPVEEPLFASVAHSVYVTTSTRVIGGPRLPKIVRTERRWRHDPRCGPGAGWNPATSRCEEIPQSFGFIAPGQPAVTLFIATNRSRIASPAAGGAAPFSGDRDTRLNLGVLTVVLPTGARDIGATKPNQSWWVKVADRLSRSTESDDVFRIANFESKEEVEFFKEIADRLQTNGEYKDGRPVRFTDQAFVFVHGCCNTFETAAFRMAQIVADLRFNGAPFLFSWPTKGDVQSYLKDVAGVTTAAEALREFLEKLLARKELTKVHLIAHSRGAHVLLAALKDWQPAGTADIARIGEIVLAAPDVSIGDFQVFARHVTKVGKSRTLYVNDSDRALSASKSLWGAEHTPIGIRQANGRPVFFDGLYSVDVTDVSSDVFWSTRHAYWAENSQILNDIGLLMLNGVQPPDTRMPIIRPVQSGRETYWVVPR